MLDSAAAVPEVAHDGHTDDSGNGARVDHWSYCGREPIEGRESPHRTEAGDDR